VALSACSSTGSTILQASFEYSVQWENAPAVHNKWLPAVELRAARETRKAFDEEFPLTGQELRKQRRVRTQRVRAAAKDRSDRVIRCDVPGFTSTFTSLKEASSQLEQEQ
jgi:hypothetical protein